MNKQFDLQSRLKGVEKYKTTLGIGMTVNPEMEDMAVNTAEFSEVWAEDLNSKRDLVKILNKIKNLPSNGVSVVADCTIYDDDSSSVDTLYVTGNQADITKYFILFCKRIWRLDNEEIMEMLSDEYIRYSLLLTTKLTPVDPGDEVQNVSDFNQIEWPEVDENDGEAQFSVKIN